MGTVSSDIHEMRGSRRYGIRSDDIEFVACVMGKIRDGHRARCRGDRQSDGYGGIVAAGISGGLGPGSVTERRSTVLGAGFVCAAE